MIYLKLNWMKMNVSAFKNSEGSIEGFHDAIRNTTRMQLMMDLFFLRVVYEKTTKCALIILTKITVSEGIIIIIVTVFQLYFV